MKIRFKASTQARKLVGVILLVCGLQLYGQQTASGAEDKAGAANITTFDYPPFQGMASTGTQPQAINPSGAIAGWYQDANGVTHGFLRTRNGTFTSFDPTGSTYTVATGITPEMTITGWYQDTSGFAHGFLRAPNGNLTTFDYPGTSAGTSAFAINPAGTTTGNYVGTDNQYHCFLRSHKGTFTSFDIPGSSQPIPLAINPAGEITGYYFDATGTHGFLRIPAHQDE